MKNSVTTCLVLIAIGLIAFGALFPVPEKHISVYGYGERQWTENTGTEYVGGDAYNYEIEATLRGGYMSGVMAMKAVTFVGGWIMLCILQTNHCRMIEMERQTGLLRQLNLENRGNGPVQETASRSADDSVSAAE